MTDNKQIYLQMHLIANVYASSVSYPPVKLECTYIITMLVRSQLWADLFDRTRLDL